MKTPDREEAVARALDLLPENDAARTDPRFVGNRDLAEEARLTRETAVDVWLTASPLTAAPPRILGRLMEKIPAAALAPPPVSRRASRIRAAVSFGGWAAAAVFALLWLVLPDRTAPSPVASLPPPPSGPAISPSPPVRSARPARDVAPDPAGNRGLREEVVRLRRALEIETGRRQAPRIKELSRPGAIARTPEESRRHLQKLLVDALRTSLEGETGAPGDPARLVIERGWPVEGVLSLEDGAVIRHRNFPESSWRELGMLNAEDGSYYDPASGLIWSPDPEARGFIGRRPVDGEELERYQRDGGESAEPSQLFAQLEPGGFLIGDPENSSIDVVIEGAGPPPEGQSQWLVWTLPDGSTREQLVTAEMYTPSGTLMGTLPDNPGLGVYVAGNSFNSTGIHAIGLQFQTRSSDGTVIETILGSGN